jgi:hypothetical protein
MDLFFNFDELFHSDEAIKHGWNNTTSDPKKLTALMNLTWYVLNPTRVEVFKKYGVGISVENGFRCESLRAFLKAAKTGHPDGECADLTCSKLTAKDLFYFMIDLVKRKIIEVDQLILEHNKNGDCLHVGYRRNACRHQIMIRTINTDGSYKYTPVQA